MARTSWFSRSVWGFVLASLLTGCGGGNGGSTGSSPAGPQPDFSINVPSSVTVTPNSTQTISISATAENAFSSSVAVSLSGLPTGVTAAPASFNLTPVASSQNVRGNAAHSSGAPGPSQTIVITADKSVAPGPIPVTVTATSGSITHTDTTSTNLPDFALAGPASTIALTAGATAQITVSADAFNGFSGPVAASLAGLPAGVSASLSNLTLTPGTPQTITLTAAANVASGSATLTLQGTSGTLSHNLEFPLALGAPIATPDFTLSATPGNLTLQAGGGSQSLTVLATAVNGFTGSITADLTGLPAGITASPATIALLPGTAQIITLSAAASSAIGTATLTIQGTSGSITHSAPVMLTITAPPPDFSLTVAPATVSLQAGGSAQSFTVSAAGLHGFAGPIAVALNGLPGGVAAMPATLMLTPGTPQQISLNASSTAAAGNTNLIVSATSGSLAHSATVTVTVQTPAPDFSLTVAPATVGLQAGGSVQSFTVSATGLHGFMSPIAVALTGLPNGLAAMPGTFMLTPGTPQQISLNASSTAAAGNTNLIVSATSGSLAHSATVTVTVQPPSPDFSLSLSPASISLPIGGAAQQVNITANAVGAFSSPVNLSITGLPTGVTASPASLTLTPGGAQTISFQASGSATAGSATVTLQGVSGTLTHSATFSLIVAAPAPDFQLFAGPSTFNLSTIADGELTIALIPMNGFNAAATVTVSGLPTGVSLENPPLPLVANIPQRLWLNAANGPGTATAGQTPITITATSGTVTHTAQVNLVITTPTLDFGPTLFAGSNPGNATPIPGLLLTPGTYTFSIMLSSAGGSDSGTTVQLSGLVPGTGLDQTQYTFSGNPTDQAVFNITVTPSAVGERGVLTAAFTGAQINHEVDLPIYVVAQPSIFSYIPPLSLQQGGATDLPYEVASTSPNRIYLYLGSDWPQNFWLNPYPVNPGDLLVAGSTGVESGQYSLSVDANSASGPTSLSLQFIEGSLSQVVPVAVQVNSFSDFNVNLEPSTIALEAGATQPLTVSATGLGAFSGPIQFSLDNLPAGVQASPQSFTLAPGSSQPVTLTAGSSYSAGGTLSVDSTSGSINHATPVAVSPGSATTTLVATGTTFSGLGVIQIFNSGTYNSVVSIAPYPNSTYPNVMQALLAYVPRSQLGSYTSNCNGNTSNSACTPVNIGIYPQAAFESPVLDQPGTITLNANVPGVPSAVLQFDQILPDFTLSFSPSTLTIPAGGGATLTVTPTAISPTFTSYCGTAFVANLYGSKVFNATFTAPPGGLNVSSSPLNLCGSNPLTTSVSVPAGTPPGDYEISVNAQLDTGYQPYYSSQAQYNPIATIAAAHTFGVGVTVTPAAAPPAPSFQLAASPVDISIAAGQSFPVTVSATGGNGFTGSISVSAANLPSGVTVSPSSFTLNAGSSQPITVSVAPGTAAASGQITLSGTSGSTTGSTQISITVQ